MEATSIHDQTPLLALESQPLAMGIVNGQWIAMRIAMIDRSRIFLSCHSYVRPQAGFELLICLSLDESPVRALVSASYVERTWQGFGIGADIVTISAADLLRWERFYHQAMAVQSIGYRNVTALRQVTFSPMAVVAPMTLSERTMDGLRRHGLTLRQADTVDQILEQVESGGVQMVLADLASAHYSGADLCRQLAQQVTPLLSVLFSDRGVAKDFEVSLYSGASMVVGRPCGQELLIRRLVDTLRGLPPLSVGAQPAGDELNFRAASDSELQSESESAAQPAVALDLSRPRRSLLHQLTAWLGPFLRGSREVEDAVALKQAAHAR